MDNRVATLLAERLGGTWSLAPLGASGFCATARAGSPGRDSLFVKAVPPARADVLEAEADGLAALAATRTIRVPAVVLCDVDADVAVLAIEWLDLSSRICPDAGERFGRALAALHAAAPVEGGGRFGWRRDNVLGATPQANDWTPDWPAFHADRRLRAITHRLRHAELEDAVERAIDMMPSLFDDGHVPRPSLIHGDLWSGNHAALADGTPVIFDPAVSVSDPEAELAMLELFGAPPASFWGAYRDLLPIDPGYAQRRPLYQLHHLLNHALLFGGGYVAQSLAVADALVRRHRMRRASM